MDKDVREKKTVKKMRNQDKPVILSAWAGERKCLDLFFAFCTNIALVAVVVDN